MSIVRRKYLYLHVIVWVYGLILINIPALELTVGNFEAATNSLLIPSLYGTLCNVFVFYGNWKYLLQRFRLKSITYWLYISIGILVISLIESKVDQWYINTCFPEKTIGFWEGIVVDNLLFHIIFFLLPSYGFWSYENYSIIKKEQQLLQEQKLQAELSLMRSQINPHFLFNVLNNLFASAHKFGDTKTANGISNLAEMMRYMLYDANEQTVPLEKEINYIEDFIELQKLRFSENDRIDITFTNSIDNPEELKIAPMLFIPFVENAFKHGISLESPSEIKIMLSQDGHTLLFSCKNTITSNNHKSPDTNSGFGLKNIEQRLKLLYPGRYQLKINKESHSFVSTLRLDL
ncbi:sensor histidine kinase [Aquimarina brevivitae]|uniref:GHKL domain-containing protein n=1 Tax=Aquimarina brevivitae TaxID=323412 RepID=A0A4Q7P1S9_9FLAO|nr:histidine kinase [Aquimarina brevivitae]RZS93811.1 GHKL domain-containing protein [Aquimarina brevivitae]